MLSVRRTTRKCPRRLCLPHNLHNDELPRRLPAFALRRTAVGFARSVRTGRPSLPGSSNSTGGTPVSAHFTSPPYFSTYSRAFFSLFLRETPGVAAREESHLLAAVRSGVPRYRAGAAR
ncbi:hypothetical protein QFZ24_004166 [Streptomyces phaeochromogenes]|jgi:hypothetical protein|nr:hypothetical protein [Streptomyces phaeochromogenes]